ncbi:hypothetical protein IQ217_04715 [Synechocystis salina LEGE 00031]|uniref:Uncharacterized protein n=1 Tax=Synechocystis salina LEGE 00031 TaxID=1828736 RepID=A0ABR9VPD0_9SYNC|nr:hypothetical protein [Synechocystis sp. LEGE 06083]MBE9239943.1 hypothetical protein [Synechocystis salina LEGE 00041]MBE9253174.1 hypothetical protein [Synechocystis salina LEGE 00031]
MVRKKQEPNRVDSLLDELLEEHQTPEEILGESGLLKQLTKSLSVIGSSVEPYNFLQAKFTIALGLTKQTTRLLKNSEEFGWSLTPVWRIALPCREL